MGAAMRIVLLIVSLAITTALASPAWSNSERVRIEYREPKNRTQEPILKSLKEHRVLETLQDLLSTFQLPRSLLLLTKDCDGVSNAWYEDNVVTMCYEFVADIYLRAPLKTTDAGITRDDTIVGTLVQVLLHETGHALFELLEIPIFGREEDAADQFAAYLILQMHREDARRIIDGVTQMLWNQSTLQKADRDAFSNVHGLPAQRFFNLICLAYGHHPWYYADIVKKGLLPEERAESCKAEYGQIAHAMDALISPHIDPDSRAKFKTTLKRFRVPEKLK
jgi:hypothetical protein